MNRLEKKLNDLLTEGVIKDYNLCSISADGIVGEESKTNNRECLCIVFNTGESLTISTICSGCLENTSLVLEEEK